MSKRFYTSRRKYDDITDIHYQSKGSSSSKLLFITVILSLLVCVMAVVIWVSILNAQSTTSYKSKIGFTETKEQETTKTEETVTKEVAKEDNNLSIDLAIETGLSILNDSNSTITDFISSSDYPWRPS